MPTVAEPSRKPRRPSPRKKTSNAAEAKAGQRRAAPRKKGPSKPQSPPSRPRDGRDFEAWDLYYRHQIDHEPADAVEKIGAGSLGLERLLALAEDLAAQGWQRVWVPGCGLSPIAPALAAAGLEVLATDISSTALEFQRQRDDIPRLAPSLSATEKSGKLICRERDPLTPLGETDFDLVLIRGWLDLFEVEDLGAVCRGLIGALRGERTAVFDLGPTDSSTRRRIERALHEAGFFVPLFELRQDYLGKLIDSGIPHSLTLDQPSVRRSGEYAEDREARLEANQELGRIRDEYLKARPEAEEADAERLCPGFVLAEILYAAG